MRRVSGKIFGRIERLVTRFPFDSEPVFIRVYRLWFGVLDCVGSSMKLLAGSGVD
jgi:hypothetical protein